MRKFLILCITGVFCLSASAEQFPGVEKLMTAQEQQAAGLHKLSEEEKRALNQWLIRYTANEAPVIVRRVEEVKEVQDQDIVSRIDGQFIGWSGKTVFKLQNGQIWKQRLKGRWKYIADSPEVVIRKNWLGYYVMEVDGKRMIGVSRVK